MEFLKYNIENYNKFKYNTNKYSIIQQIHSILNRYSEKNWKENTILKIIFAWYSNFRCSKMHR